jgi:hypothetical protein
VEAAEGVCEEVLLLLSLLRLLLSLLLLRLLVLLLLLVSMLGDCCIALPAARPRSLFAG